MGVRRFVEGLALAAGITSGVGAAKAEIPQAPEIAIQKAISVDSSRIEKASSQSPEELITSALASNLESEYQKGENIPSVNETTPGGGKVKDLSLPGNVRMDIDVAKIDQARKVALRLAAYFENKGGAIGLKVDL